jgi:hypothetical protein
LKFWEKERDTGEKETRFYKEEGKDRKLIKEF